MKIYLRPVTIEDGKTIVAWRNTQSIRNHCFDKTEVTEETNAAFYRNNIETEKYKQFIVERIDDDYGVASYSIATIYLKDMDYVNHRCELCIFTSNDQEWNEESQSIAVKMLIDKAFKEYGMHKIYSYVFTFNENEATLLERAGFKREALLEKEAIDIYENYVDVYRMSIFAV